MTTKNKKQNKEKKTVGDHLAALDKQISASVLQYNLQLLALL